MRFVICFPSRGLRRARCAAEPLSDAISCAVAPFSDLCRPRILESTVSLDSVGASSPLSTRTPVTIHSWPCLEILILFGLMENPSWRTILIAVFLIRHTCSGPEMVISSRYCVKCALCCDASRANRPARGRATRFAIMGLVGNPCGKRAAVVVSCVIGRQRVRRCFDGVGRRRGYQGLPF